MISFPLRDACVKNVPRSVLYNTLQKRKASRPDLCLVHETVPTNWQALCLDCCVSKPLRLAQHELLKPPDLSNAAIADLRSLQSEPNSQT